jgi:hypothetical protein
MNGITAVAGNSGRRDLFYLDDRFALKQRKWNGTEWTHDWISLGGIFTSVVAAVATMAHRPLDVSPGHGVIARRVPHTEDLTLMQRLDVFGLGLDYAMYHKTLWGEPADAPGPWENLGGIFTSAPAALALDGRLHVFGLGTDYSMYLRTWNGSSWSSGWERLGGYFSSAPALVCRGPGLLNVFARGADFTLRHRSLEGNAWTTGWQNLGGSLASPPIAVSWGPNRLDVFAINHEDGAIIHRWWDGEIWNDWEKIAGNKDLMFTSMPAAATWGSNRLDVFATSSNNVLHHVWSAEDAWSVPQPMSPEWRIASTPTVLATAPHQLQIVAPGTDGNLYHKQWKETGWEPVGWQQLGDHTRLPSRYRFSIDYVRVHTARSLDNDTVTGHCSLADGNWPLLSKTQSQGKLGFSAVNYGVTNLMTYGPVTVELCESAVFNYMFINGVADPLLTDTILKKAGEKLSAYAVESVIKKITAGLAVNEIAIAGVASPVMGPLLGLVGGWLLGELQDLINEKCDGVLALEEIVVMGNLLQMKTIGGQPFTMTTYHDGTDTPAGCGPNNSRYEVKWSITAM